MSFREECRQFGLDVEADDAKIFDEVVDLAAESIVEGSALTNAPGQPVRSGGLRDSWEVETLSASEKSISTDHPAAGVIEDDIGNRRYRNHGPHSFKLTVAGMDRLVDAAVDRVRGAQ